MTIYDIEAEIMDCIDQETGEVIDIDRLNALEMERDRKISSVSRIWSALCRRTT